MPNDRSVKLTGSAKSAHRSITYVHGDFVDLAGLVRPAEIATLESSHQRPSSAGNGCSASAIRAPPAW